MFDKVCLGGEEVGERIGWVRGEGRGDGGGGGGETVGGEGGQEESLGVYGCSGGICRKPVHH